MQRNFRLSKASKNKTKIPKQQQTKNRDLHVSSKTKQKAELLRSRHIRSQSHRHRIIFSSFFLYMFSFPFPTRCHKFFTLHYNVDVRFVVMGCLTFSLQQNGECCILYVCVNFMAFFPFDL